MAEGVDESQKRAQACRLRRDCLMSHIFPAKEDLFCILEDLLWDDRNAMFQLDDYCLNRRNRSDTRVRKLLMEKGILAGDDTLPDATNEVMYEMHTGHRPFWLGQDDANRD